MPKIIVSSCMIRKIDGEGGRYKYGTVGALIETDNLNRSPILTRSSCSSTCSADPPPPIFRMFSLDGYIQDNYDAQQLTCQ